MQRTLKRLRVVKLILIGQFLAMILVGAVGFAQAGKVAGLSALLGGLIAWVPNVYFAVRAFRYRGARVAQKIVRSFYAGAFGKYVLTMAMFGVVFIMVRPLNPLALFIGFILVMAVYWVVPLLTATRQRRRK